MKRVYPGRGYTVEVALVETDEVRRAHFEAWFMRTRGVTAGEAVPGVPVLLMFDLYAAAFKAHEKAGDEWDGCGRWVGETGFTCVPDAVELSAVAG